MTHPYITAVVTGAGLSTRMASSKNKMLIEIDGLRVLERTLLALKASKLIDFFVVVVNERIRKSVEEEILPVVFGEGASVFVCLGGPTRQDSVKAGLKYLPEETELVLVHDGARPFIMPEVVKRCVDRMALRDVDGVIASVPMKDTIKMVSADGVIAQTPNRALLFAAQTPQLFWKAPLLRAYAHDIWNERPVTDDAQMIELAGGRVATVMGDEANIKITTPGDLVLGEKILAERMQ